MSEPKNAAADEKDDPSVVNPFADDYDNDLYDAQLGGGGCYECGGRGWKVVCIDDMCHGQDECIHGDPPRPCRVCNPKGDRFDGYWG